MSKRDRIKKRKAKRVVAPRGPQGLPELAPTQRREPSGRKQRKTRGEGGTPREERNADIVALNARARHNGKPETHEGRREVAGQSWSGHVGSAIHLRHSGEEADRLHRTYAAYIAADLAYCRRYLGQQRYAKTAKIEMMVERFETRDDDSPDPRSDEERDRAAVTTWMRWQGYLGMIPRAQATAIQSALLHDLVRDASKLTRQGRAFVDGLEALADIVDQRA